MITRYECPIGSCPWTLDDPGPDPAEGKGKTIEEAAFAALLAHALRTEPVVRGHLEGHSLLEWVQEVQRLCVERDQAERDALRYFAILLRRLGRTAEITDAEMATEPGTVQRGPGPFSTRFTVTEQATRDQQPTAI